MQFFNIKYEVVIIASLLRKIKIFEAIKPLKFAMIYAGRCFLKDRISCDNRQFNPGILFYTFRYEIWPKPAS